MSYNPNAGVRNLHGTRPKMQRANDLQAMGIAAPSNPPAYMPPPGMQNPPPMMNMGAPVGIETTHAAGFPNAGGAPAPNQNYNYMQPSYNPQTQAAFPDPKAGTPYNNNAPGMAPAGPGAQFNSAIPPQFSMFQQPLVQDMAMQYGQRLADQGKQMVETQFEKYIPVAKLKYYFAVDNKYVINKIRLLFFPFLHKDWSLKYDQENPVQPRYDINAPDLYIPTMAYITYVVVAGLMLVMQSRFTPEQLGIQASSALAYSIFELVVYLITLYVVNIKTSLKTLDLLAFAGYKFVIIVTCLLVSTLFHGFGYYLALAYSSFTLGLFLLRTLKTKVLNDATSATAVGGAINYDPYGNPQQLDYSGGRKRKLYFLFLLVGGQAFLSFLLSKHLYFPDAATLEARKLQF